MNRFEYRAFTTKSDGIVDRLLSDVIIIPNQQINPGSENRTIKAIWDTGASATAISTRVAKECNLLPIGKTTTYTANGPRECNQYLIDIGLPNHVIMQNIMVTEADLYDGLDMLIGMNVIIAGDFSITNVGGKTTFSFRIPSCEEIDYVLKSVDERIESIKGELARHGSKKCGCGSGKQIKMCCGQKDMREALKRKQELLVAIGQQN